MSIRRNAEYPSEIFWWRDYPNIKIQQYKHIGKTEQNNKRFDYTNKNIFDWMFPKDQKLRYSHTRVNLSWGDCTCFLHENKLAKYSMKLHHYIIKNVVIICFSPLICVLLICIYIWFCFVLFCFYCLDFFFSGKVWKTLSQHEACNKLNLREKQ